MNKKPEFKEKFVEISEEVFKGATITINSSTSSLFWDDYLILPPNLKCITRIIQSKSEESLLDIRQNLKQLFIACLNQLDLSDECSKNEQTRQLNAIAILTVLIRNLFSKRRLTHFNIISILTGLDEADVLFSKLIKAVQKLIQNPSIRSSALQLALVLSAGNDNINQNGLNSYFMMNDISSSLFNVLTMNEINENDCRDVIMLIGMLSNYNKYEFKNPYLSYIRKLKQEKAFENIIQMYTALFISLRNRYIEINNDEDTFSKTLVTYMSKWFFSYASAVPSETENSQSFSTLPSAQIALILPLFDLINVNSYFISTLTKTCTKIDMDRNNQQENNRGEESFTFLSSLLSFASYLFENNRNERTHLYSRLLLTIILRLTEENTIMDYIAKESTNAVVRLCRQRSPQLPFIKTKRSMFSVILDDMLIFIRHNIRKKLELSSYKLALSVIHRILCFLNKHKIRLEYHWIELWPTLASTLHFTILHLDIIKDREGFNTYISTLISVFNMCVTHGERFLTDTKSYDSLYYEIIRATEDFLKLSEYVNDSITMPNNERATPSITLNEFHNIKLICKHFKPALDEWQTIKNIKFPTPEQVMSVINENYATLELKPMDKLDSYIVFNEIPMEMGFFRQIVRMAVTDYLEYYTLSMS
ncbi:uncharacterized protein BX663DRAFT_521020 [Cokeromyces recurvatus]|uniref:uncharacterized protein n=1 Tax=Cokeromyces recurvatus TaxID=90255 RepID=UPI00221F210B|nr:uncharacterized protein BX663DRAFT_521020 [Cokeromyces recurvatus]KAI7899470.1 hypothetical protein BX663DRAFT_521020 [Cokeromyces recurvatus]